MDGNRRWAERHALSQAEAYRAGAAKVGELLEWSGQTGIGVVSVWALSLPNLRRSPTEVEVVVNAIVEGLWRLAAEQCWRLRPIGSLDMLPRHAAEQVRQIERATADRDDGVANIALAYEGRAEIASAVQSLICELAAAGVPAPQIAGQVTTAAIHARLHTSGQPDPDLIIRTSGEQRLSGFMPWQSSDAELHFTQALWPDITRADFDAALCSYAVRQRRFGQ
jgi:short-chain Z-isoprenyl diphosphate synthase